MGSVIYIVLILLLMLIDSLLCFAHDINHEQLPIDKSALRAQAKEMFMHGYNSYMKYAYPHDELMPLTCRGRARGITPSRECDSFSLTLVDTLDTLVVVGELDEFERAVRLVVNNVRFDSNLVVSVFETNIRMVGGLLSAHFLAKLVQSQDKGRLIWYSNQMLDMAVSLADRLLPAFNTTSGLPYSRINLRYGMLSYLREQRDTCTACGGTMLLEFATLSRLTGNKVYEQKARKAMDFLWSQRNRASNLMGTVLNVHSGDWVRRDAGIGAGIDSYYEYCLKTYILLGDDDYLYRFNKHYDAIMRYINKGPMFIDVHMHKPTVASRSFMDALLAFWPALQVLKGDLKSAIEFHETLHQVIKKHRFLPEAFTHDLQIHWAQYPLRPEFIESTYMLYRATKDPHYLRVAKNVMDSLNELVRVDCGFAGVRDIRTMSHEDRMDSYVLAETFKYLYMIFSEPSDLIFDPDNYVLTTEAHFLPLSIGDIDDEVRSIAVMTLLHFTFIYAYNIVLPRRVLIDPDELLQEKDMADNERKYRSACPNIVDYSSSEQLTNYANALRSNIRAIMSQIVKQSDGAQQSSSTCPQPSERLRAWAFSSSNSEHVRQLNQMGIQVQIQADGRLHLLHTTSEALSPQWATMGMEFMQEMMQMVSHFEKDEFGAIRIERVVQILSYPSFGYVNFIAAPAQFGSDLHDRQVDGEVRIAVPSKGCSTITNSPTLKGRIAVVYRHECMFQEKARFVQKAGAIALIIVDNVAGSSIETSPPFAMSGDTSVEDDINIPVVFLFDKEGSSLIEHVKKYPGSTVRISDRLTNPSIIIEQFFKHHHFARITPHPSSEYIEVRIE
ncbi:unnamed protein product [Anisakis simplex]|uniref:alpha-1,2-Mannosidase n=1 Tax=Anisakis simplex TaxID=6269 RepID=A0A0M3JYB3_ANISI|nr:unnamed protein product [Anisakis simplex]